MENAKKEDAILKEASAVQVVVAGLLLVLVLILLLFPKNVIVLKAFNFSGAIRLTADKTQSPQRKMSACAKREKLRRKGPLKVIFSSTSKKAESALRARGEVAWVCAESSRVEDILLEGDGIVAVVWSLLSDFLLFFLLGVFNSLVDDVDADFC